MLERIDTSVKIRVKYKRLFKKEYVVNLKLTRDTECLLSDTVSYQLLKTGKIETQNYKYVLTEDCLTITQKDFSYHGGYHAFTLNRYETQNLIEQMVAIQEAPKHIVTEEERLLGRINRLHKKFICLREYQFHDKRLVISARYMDACHKLNINIENNAYLVTYDKGYEYIDINGEQLSSRDIILNKEDFI